MNYSIIHVRAVALFAISWIILMMNALPLIFSIKLSQVSASSPTSC